jgi:hypothetical protein
MRLVSAVIAGSTASARAAPATLAGGVKNALPVLPAWS